MKAYMTTTTSTIESNKYHALVIGLLSTQLALRMVVLQMAELAPGALHASSMHCPDTRSFTEERMPHAATGNAFRPVLRPVKKIEKKVPIALMTCIHTH